MYPCFTISRILGIFPYKINNSTFEIPKSRYISSTIIFCIFCVCGGIIFYKLDISGAIMHLDVPRSLECHCYYLLGTFTASVTYISKRSQLQLLQTILKISSKLSSESYQKLSRLIHVKDILLFFFLISLATICCVHLPLYTIMQTLLALYITLIQLQVDMQYMNYVCILKVCFKKINDNLVNIQKLIISDKPHLLRRIYHEQRNSFLLMELTVLRKQHLILSDTVQILNMTFSLQLLVTIVMTFSEITFNLYFYILVTMFKREKDKFWLYLIFSMVVIYYLTKIILIVWACESSKDQAAKIGVTVHDLLNSISDKQIKDELQLFSLQILHRENIFSAKGLSVDSSLLTAMVASITTYLLILIQFLITSHSCDKNTINLTKIMY
ncbi:hypothetical protein P5V15_009562 [Pogonomyrmex californicus]